MLYCIHYFSFYVPNPCPCYSHGVSLPYLYNIWGIIGGFLSKCSLQCLEHWINHPNPIPWRQWVGLFLTASLMFGGWRWWQSCNMRKCCFCVEGTGSFLNRSLTFSYGGYLTKKKKKGSHFGMLLLVLKKKHFFELGLSQASAAYFKSWLSWW